MTDDRAIPPPSPPERRDGCLMALMIVVGGILLLPGICVLAFVVSDPKGMLTDSMGWFFIVVCAASTAGGVALIWPAVRRPSR